MMHTHHIKVAFGLSLLGAFLFPQPAQAQLEELQQTVFGMDCAPCAYSLEKRIGDIDGVESISMSLNDGQAHVRLQPGNRVTLETVRAAVRSVGFSPEDGAVRVSGTLSEEDGHWFLVASTGERFILPQQPASATDGAELTVTGEVDKEKDPATDAWILHR